MTLLFVCTLSLESVGPTPACGCCWWDEDERFSWTSWTEARMTQTTVKTRWLTRMPVRGEKQSGINFLRPTRNEVDIRVTNHTATGNQHDSRNTLNRSNVVVVGTVAVEDSIEAGYNGLLMVVVSL